MKTAEERPKVKYYYWKDATVSEVAESYNKAPELFKYAQALDNYIDYLEEYASQQQQPTDEWKEFTLLNDEPTIATDSTEFVNYKPSGENIEKEIKQLFVGKVAGVLGGQKTYDLLKEATETIKELPRFKQTDK